MISFSKGVLDLSHGDSRARASSSHLALVGVKLGESRLDRVGLKTEFIKKASVCLDNVCLYLVLKVDSVDMLKFTIHTQVSCFGFQFLV